MTLADTIGFTTPWQAAGFVVTMAVFILGLVNTRSNRHDDKAQKATDEATKLAREQDKDALAAHHAHDDERFDALDRRLTAEHSERRKSDHDIANALTVTNLALARIEERLNALRQAK